MALQAKKDFPEINFAKSIIIGNSLSDMLFGNNLGMTCYYIGNEIPWGGSRIIDTEFNYF